MFREKVINSDLLILHILVLSWIKPKQGQSTSPWAWHCWTPGLLVSILHHYPSLAWEHYQSSQQGCHQRFKNVYEKLQTVHNCFRKLFLLQFCHFSNLQHYYTFSGVLQNNSAGNYQLLQIYQIIFTVFSIISILTIFSCWLGPALVLVLFIF